MNKERLDCWHILCYMLTSSSPPLNPASLIGGRRCLDVGMSYRSGRDRVKMMKKKIVCGLVASLLFASVVPSTGWCWHGGPPPRHHHGGHGDDALLWGLGGLVLGAGLVAAAVDDPPPRRVVYVEPEPVTYAYPPPSNCRWERTVVDRYGRPVYDRYGEPIREYTNGPCDYQPPW